jgi:hypothetical protein
VGLQTSAGSLWLNGRVCKSSGLEWQNRSKLGNLGVVLQATKVYKAPNRFLAKTCASDIGVLKLG